MADDDDQQHPDLILVRLAQQGDRQAQQRLAERLLRVLKARGRGFLRRYDRTWSIDEMVNDVWLVLLERSTLAKWRPDGGRSLENYATMVATAHWLNMLKSELAQKRGGSAEHLADDFEDAVDHGPTPEQQAMDADTLAQLQRYLDAHLPPRGQLVFRLVFTDGLGAQEAADILGVRPQVIHNWVFRIRRAARDFLNGSEGQAC